MISLHNYPLRASRRSVEQIAEVTASRLRYMPSFSLYEAVSRLSISVKYAPAPYECLRIRVDRHATIILEPIMNAQQSLFQVACSLAHFFLHYPSARKKNGATAYTALRDPPGNPLSRHEAVWWAAAFLMPREQFSEKYTANPTEAARYFCVSAPMARARATALGL